jgi:hypothetical protein
VARTDHVRSHLRTVLYAGLRESFDDSGIPLDDCYQEDRGDGVMIVVPPRHDLAELITSVIERLHAAVRRHNQMSNDAASLQLRVAVHFGECRSDDNGLVSTALNHAFRLLDATPLKEALQSSGTGVALIVSQRVHDDVVKHGRGLVDPDAYRRVEVVVKETVTTAWIRVPGMAPAAQHADVIDIGRPPEPTPPPRLEGGSAQIMFELVDRTLDIPLMAQERGREQVVSALPIAMAGVIPRSADARSDTYAIIRTCLDYPGGLQQFLQAIRGFVGDSMALRRLEEAIARLLLRPESDP